MCVTNVVIAAQPFVRTEGLLLNESQRGLMDVASGNVPSWREAGLVKNQRTLGIGNNPVTIAHHDLAGGLADVDSMVAVGGMSQDSFVFLVEGVHGRPREGHSPL